jgi:flagellar basal-body rod modification protein FlgD
MNGISGISASSVQASSADAAKQSLDYDSFLKLLLQQLKSQDPTNPVDQKETLAQLATFSNVEQSIKFNQKLDQLLQQQRLGDSVSLIGKSVESLVGGSTGVVRSVEVSGGNVKLLLENGSSIDMAEGVKIGP